MHGSRAAYAASCAYYTSRGFLAVSTSALEVLTDAVAEWLTCRILDL